CRQALDFPLTF
nr:immunoglobulin light chain junction region [Macaca mulatta]